MELSNYAQIIGKEWKGRSKELAEWAMERLVNRRDVWGQYTGLTKAEKLTAKKTYKALTLPQRSMRGKDMVTLEKLTRHFGAMKRNHLIGLHASCEENTSRWLGIDIDLHDPEAVDFEDASRRNFAAALGWWERLQELGYDPLLTDSNGAGGFHIWVLFADPVAAEIVYAFGQELIGDWEARNLDGPPETFPKNGARSGEKLGAWLRLPGLHHTRDHYTKVWSGEAWLDQPWVEGDAAVEVMLRAVPGPVPVVKDLDAKAETKSSAKRKKKGDFSGKRKSAATVCVDLDGVLAQYDGWRGVEVIGDPIDGAVEFLRDLRKHSRVMIHTVRIGKGDGKSLKVVEAWLREHGFEYDEIWTGFGKPPANAYVDDRGVVCRPQDDGPKAFERAAEAVERLVD